MSLGHGASIVRSGLVLHLDAANRKSYSGSGTSWNDLSDNLKTNTLTNGPVYSASFSGMISFDGIDDYSITSNISAPTGINYTASMWIRLDSSTAGVDSRFFWHGNYGVLLYKNAANQFFCYIRNESNVVVQALFGTLALGTWLNITGTYDGANIKVYINGQFITQLAQTGNIQAANLPNLFSIGGSAAASFYSKCDISQVLIYNTTLTNSQIQQNFNALRGRYSI
jgi:hypothetical protein